MSVSILIIVFSVLCSGAIILVLNLLGKLLGGSSSVLFISVMGVGYFIVGTILSLLSSKQTCGKTETTRSIWHGILSGILVVGTMFMISYIGFFNQPFKKIMGETPIFGIKLNEMMCQFFYVTLHFVLISFVNSYNSIKNVCVSSPDEIKEKIDKLNKKIAAGSK